MVIADDDSCNENDRGGEAEAPKAVDGTDILNNWIHALDEEARQEDPDDSGEGGGPTLPAVNGNDNVPLNEVLAARLESALHALENEDTFEVQQGNLPSLAGDNQPNFPQENAKYFRTKNYCRKDKYPLCRLINNLDVILPTLVESFSF